MVNRSPYILNPGVVKGGVFPLAELETILGKPLGFLGDFGLFD
jgi:hypothetical protein